MWLYVAVWGFLLAAWFVGTGAPTLALLAYRLVRGLALLLSWPLRALLRD